MFYEEWDILRKIKKKGIVLIFLTIILMVVNIMKRNSLFDKFVKTGKIEDYLRYKKEQNGVSNDTRKGNSTKNN